MPPYIGFVLNETTVTADILNRIEETPVNTEKRFMRVAFISVDRKIKKELNKRLYGIGFAVEFFDDFEKSKQWLVTEGL